MVMQQRHVHVAGSGGQLLHKRDKRAHAHITSTPQRHAQTQPPLFSLPTLHIVYTGSYSGPVSRGASTSSLNLSYSASPFSLRIVPFPRIWKL